MRFLITSLALCASLCTACGGGDGADSKLPEPPPIPKCMFSGNNIYLNLVGWDPNEIATLEAIKKTGLVVVNFDPNTCEMSVLSNCKSGVSYRYNARDPAPGGGKIESTASIEANAPLGLVRAHAALEQTGALQLDTVAVGSLDVHGDKYEYFEAAPNCNGTHYVSAHIIGAFALYAAKSGKGETGVSVGNSGVDGTVAQGAQVYSASGSFDACAAGKSNDSAPPPNCTTTISVKLEPFEQPPNLAVDAPQVASFNNQGVGVRMPLSAMNNGPHEMTTSSATGTVSFGELGQLGPITVPLDVKLTPGQVTQIPIEVTTSYQQVMQLVSGASSKSAIPYHINGSVTIVGQKMTSVIPITYDGTVTREQINAWAGGNPFLQLLLRK